MKRPALLVFCLVLTVGSGWASTGIITNPALITQGYIDWCVNYGCLNNDAQFPTSTAWTGSTGLTGTVGLSSGQSFYNLQEGVTWLGQFASNEGILYNGRLFGNNDANFVLTFSHGALAAGTYMQSDYYGPFTGYVTLYDQLGNVIASYSAAGNSGFGEGTALFLGAYDTVPFYSVQFGVLDQFGLNDIAMGTTLYNATPEPGTLALFGSSVLGLAGYLRRRIL